jgi:hypothetical protein
MAEDYTGVREYPTFKTFTGATTFTEIKLPSNCSRVQIGSDAQALYVANDTIDGANPSAVTHKGFIPVDNYLTFRIGRGATRDSNIFVALQTGTGTISIIIEE